MRETYLIIVTRKNKLFVILTKKGDGYCIKKMAENCEKFDNIMNELQDKHIQAFINTKNNT